MSTKKKIGKEKRKGGSKSLHALSAHIVEKEKEIEVKKQSKVNALDIKVGDYVFVKASEEGEPSYVAQVVAFKGQNQEQVRLRWYYRPEDSHSGRQVWHGDRELFSSNTFDWNPIGCLEGKCFMHSIDEYDSLSSICPADFYSRFSYNPSQGRFHPDIIPVHCFCELPYNPDRGMVMCEGCKDWFHWDCVNYEGNKGGDKGGKKKKKKNKSFYCSATCKAKKKEKE